MPVGGAVLWAVLGHRLAAPASCDRQLQAESRRAPGPLGRRASIAAAGSSWGRPGPVPLACRRRDRLGVGIIACGGLVSMVPSRTRPTPGGGDSLVS